MTNSEEPRSYLGIGSVVLSGIAWLIIAAFYAANFGSSQKLAGFEGVIIFPACWLLWLVGCAMGSRGLKSASNNPCSRLGVWANMLSLWFFPAMGALGAFLHWLRSGP